MKKYLPFILILFTLNSCEKIINISTEMQNDYIHNDALNSSTKIVIETSSNNSIEEENASKVYYEAINQKQLKEFKKLFDGAEKTDYCCCPNQNFTISFYYYNNNFDYYYVDTTENKNKVRIYEKSYQYSYLVDKLKWMKFINEIEKQQ